MHTAGAISFDEYWAKNWTPTGQPGAFDAAMREVALKAWNASINSASSYMALKDSEIRLMAGELTAGEMRTTKAVMAGCKSLVRELIQKEPAFG